MGCSCRAPIVQEAGGVVADFKGGTIGFMGRQIMVVINMLQRPCWNSERKIFRE